MSEFIHHLYSAVIVHPYWVVSMAVGGVTAVSASLIWLTRSWLSNTGHSDYTYWS